MLILLMGVAESLAAMTAEIPLAPPPLWRHRLGDLILSAKLVLVADISNRMVLQEGRPACEVTISRMRPIIDPERSCQTIPTCRFIYPLPGAIGDRSAWTALSGNEGVSMRMIVMASAMTDTQIAWPSVAISAGDLADTWPMAMVRIPPSREEALVTAVLAFRTTLGSAQLNNPSAWTTRAKGISAQLDQSLWLADMACSRLDDVPDVLWPTLGDRSYGRRWRMWLLARIEDVSIRTWDASRRQSFSEFAAPFFARVDDLDLDLRMAMFQLVYSWSARHLVTWRAVKPWQDLSLRDALFTNAFLGRRGELDDDGGPAIAVRDVRPGYVQIRLKASALWQEMVASRQGERVDVQGAHPGLDAHAP